LQALGRPRVRREDRASAVGLKSSLLLANSPKNQAEGPNFGAKGI